jgi:hypothetical protein
MRDMVSPPCYDLRVADRVQNADTVKLPLPLPMFNMLGRAENIRFRDHSVFDVDQRRRFSGLSGAGPSQHFTPQINYVALGTKRTLASVGLAT